MKMPNVPTRVLHAARAFSGHSRYFLDVSKEATSIHDLNVYDDLRHGKQARPLRGSMNVASPCQEYVTLYHSPTLFSIDESEKHPFVGQESNVREASQGQAKSNLEVYLDASK